MMESEAEPEKPKKKLPHKVLIPIAIFVIIFVLLIALTEGGSILPFTYTRY
jgi:uncharacterized membrane protein YvbJ